MAKSERVTIVSSRATRPTPLEKLHNYIRTTMAAYENPDRKSNEGRLLHEIWLWQEVAALASACEKAAWQAAQLGDDSLIPPDDELRSEAGESIVVDSKSYSCVVRVDAARRTFDRDTFIAIVSREHQIAAAELLRIAEQAKEEGTPPLSKRVIGISK